MDVAIPTLDQVLGKVDAFLARHGMKETRLGRDATGESSPITSMRAGRHPSLKTLIRLDQFMTEHDAREAAAAADLPFSSPSPVLGPPGKLLQSLADAARTVA